MPRNEVLVISVAVVLGAFFISFLMAPLPEGRAPRGFVQAYDTFQNSRYLSDLWDKSCDLSLDERDNLLMISRIYVKGGEANATCFWNVKPTASKAGKGLVFSGENTNMDNRWLRCGDDPTFSNEVLDAIYKKSNLIFLAKRPSPRDKAIYYVVTGKCRQDGGCVCGSQGNVTGVAYAVWDANEDKIYW
jgi:hypothetical protein